MSNNLFSSSKLPNIRITNVVTCCSYGCQLELKKIALYARNVEYNPRKFSAAVMKIKNPMATALMFSTGKVVITGLKNEEDILKAYRRFGRILQKLHFPILNLTSSIKITNIVATFDFGRIINLNLLNTIYHAHSTYEPELFPGLTFKFLEKINRQTIEKAGVALIFNSGKIVLTGLKRFDDVDIFFLKIMDLLRSLPVLFKK